jgi:lipopolysaccharide export system permease protein
MSSPSFFPSRRLGLYVGRMFLIRTFAILAMLVLVLQSLDLLGESGDILAVPGNTSADVWRYVGLRVPQIIETFLPFSVLLGTLLTLFTLNQNSEVIAMKSGGMSAHQILAPLIVASLGVAAISFTFNERIVARATATLDAWQKVEYARIPIDSGVRTNVWVRSGSNLINAQRVSGHGNAVLLDTVKIYGIVGDKLASIVTAAHARPSAAQAGQWLLEDAKRFEVEAGRMVPLGNVTSSLDATPDRFTLNNVDGDGLSFGPLRSAIAELKAAGRPTHELETLLWHKISGPLSAVLMPLLGAVAGFGLARSGKLFIRLVIGMGLGFAYFVADNFGVAMGNLGAYPPWLAAWGPFFLFLMIGELVLVRSEE